MCLLNTDFPINNKVKICWISQNLYILSNDTPSTPMTPEAYDVSEVWASLRWLTV